MGRRAKNKRAREAGGKRMGSGRGGGGKGNLMRSADEWERNQPGTLRNLAQGPTPEASAPAIESAGGGAGGGEAAPRGVTTGNADPRLTRHADRVEAMGDRDTYMDLAKGDRDLLGQGLRELGEGQGKALRGQLSRMGTLGKGSGEEFGLGQIGGNVMSAFGKGSADILSEQSKSYDDFLLGSTGALREPGMSALKAADLAERSQGRRDATALAQAQLKSNAQLSQSQLAIQRKQMEREAERTKISDWMQQTQWALGLSEFA